MKIIFVLALLAVQNLLITQTVARPSTTKQILPLGLQKTIREDFITLECLILADSSMACTCDLILSIEPVPLPASIRKTISSICERINGESSVRELSDGCDSYYSTGAFDAYAYLFDIANIAQGCGQSLVDLTYMTAVSVIMAITGGSQSRR